MYFQFAMDQNGGSLEHWRRNQKNIYEYFLPPYDNVRAVLFW